MNPRSELALYGDVRAWLLGYLRGIHPRAEIAAYDTHHVQLSAFLFQERLHESFPAYAAYEIKVDITGVIRSGSFTSLAFVECKIGLCGMLDNFLSTA